MRGKKEEPENEKRSRIEKEGKGKKRKKKKTTAHASTHFSHSPNLHSGTLYFFLFYILFIHSIT